MDRQNFKWIPEHPSEELSNIENTAEAVDARSVLWNRAKPYLPFLAFAVVVLSLLLTRNGSGSPVQESKTDVESSEDVLVPLIAIAKGQGIEPALLRMIPVRRKDLTPRQRIQAVRIEDLSKLSGRVRAKKNLPPQQILYWSDLSLELQQAQSRNTPVRIHYPQGESL
jgi:hypothetical protein